MTKGRTEQSTDLFEEALGLAKSAAAHLNYEDALRQVLAALKLAEAQRNALRQSRAHTEHSRLLSKLCLYAEAVSSAHTALRLAANDPASAARALGALGTASQTLTPPETHFRNYESMLAKAVEAGDADLEAHAHRGLCAANLIQYQISSHPEASDPALRGYARAALQHALEATRICEANGDEEGALLGRHLKAGSLIVLGRVAEARRESEEMLRIACASSFRAAEAFHAIALKHLGDIDLLEGRLESAEQYLAEALSISERRLDLRKAADCLKTLSVITERKGDFKAALAWERKSADAFARFASAAARAHAAAMEVRLGAEHARALASAQQERADRLALSNEALAREANRLARTSQEDALTGITNRRGIDARLNELVANPAVHARCSLALLDIDHFKQVNDRFLHTTGDKVLRRMGGILRESSREHDVVARFGGEEFAVVFIDIDPAQVALACERIRQAVADVNWSELHAELTVTVSIGFCHFAESGNSVEELLTVADARLFRAKRAGRNRVVGP